MPSRISPRPDTRDTATRRLAVGQAVALGLLHGPAELLPASSSGHVTVIPWLLGSQYPELDPELRKAFEVVLHAGSTAGWLLAGCGDGQQAWGLPRRRIPVLVLMTAPAGVAGLVLERSIERHLGRPSTIAAGLLLGAIAMAAADRVPERRQLRQAGARDGLWVGLAQACALFPGISRTGATLTVARLRGFRRRDAWRLSMHAATPVIAGATALKLARLRRGVPGSRQGAALSAGAASSFGSTLVLTRLVRPANRSWPLLPFAAYRAGLALAIIVRLSRAGASQCVTNGQARQMS